MTYKVNQKTLRITFQSFFILLFINLFLVNEINAQDNTWAEKLGFPKGKKIVILHVDDVGMSVESNEGAIQSMTNGVATSCSIMMPCPWVSGYLHFLKDNPETDAGLHLTLTSEWNDYRWGPLSGKKNVPGLVDSEGALWGTVEEVVEHASPDEVEQEIKAQIDRCLTMGFTPTHLDSHMGTLFATHAFIQRYVKVGIEYSIPIMFPAGHNTLIAEELKSTAADMKMAKEVGIALWNAGLPVIDDLHNTSYSLKLPNGAKPTTDNIRKSKTAFYINALKEVKPGITYMIMHCNTPSEHFGKISGSGQTRTGDYLAMTDPKLRKFIADEGIILTTMKELMERRKKIKN